MPCDTIDEDRELRIPQVGHFIKSTPKGNIKMDMRIKNIEKLRTND